MLIPSKMVTFDNSDLVFPDIGGILTVYSLTALQSGRTVKNTAASAQVNLNLPAAAVGLYYPMIVTSTQTFEFVAAGSDKIYWAGNTPSGATHIYSSMIYSTVTLRCPVIGIWVVVGTPIGDWSIG